MRNFVLSVDTRNAKTAIYAIEKGAKIINDVSAWNHDQGLLEALCDLKPGYILTHARGTPETMQIDPHYENILLEVARFFDLKLNELVRNGMPENRIALDPGIGFGKNLFHNLELLRNIDKFKIFGRPLIGALSMKSMFCDLLGHGLRERETDTALASALLWQKGVFWHRAHKPGQVADAIKLAKALIAPDQGE